ncbi:hypothetical protein HQ563_11435 [bacterium]|nr:hypothetical protein [bacterium]
MKEETTCGPGGPQKIARALSLAAEAPADGHLGCDQPPEELLGAILANKLILDPAVPHSLPSLLNWSCNEVLAAAGQTMAHLLLTSETDLAVIKTIKDYGKELAQRRDTDSEQIAGTAIYYAAIASALVFHQHRITQYPPEKLHEAFSKLQQKPWIPSELMGLFEKAIHICRQPTKGSNSE